MPLAHLQPKNSSEFREPSFKRGFLNNLFTAILLIFVVSGLIYMAVLLYAGPPIGDLADSAYKFFLELIK